MAVNSIRFSGLASGLDTESIVKSLTTPYQSKVDAKKQQQTLMEWKKDAWKEMNSKLFNFYDKYVNTMRMESTFKKTIVSSSNASVVEIDKNSTLPAGTHDLKVKNLATGTRVETSQVQDKTLGKVATGSTTLNNIGITSDTTIKVKANQKGEVEIKLSPDMTLDAVASKIKQELPDYNVNFDSGMGAFFISSKKTGASQEIEISGDPDVLQNLGIKNTSGVAKGTQAEDATVVYNGVEAKFESNSIRINDVSMTLKAIGETTLVSTQDTESIYNTIKEFVDEYNALIEDINTKINADSARGYAPLTDEQKEAMSDKEIEAWEKKIKDSLFRNDESLKSLTQTMRSIFSSSVEINGKTISLSSIGITTGGWQENGKLYIDEEKLKDAITNDTDTVVQLFSANGKTDALDDPTKGIGDRLYDTITKLTMSSELRTKYSFYNDKKLDKDISTAKTDYNKLVERLQRMEDMYYKKFTAMEKMLQSLNSQSSWLTQQLG